MKNQISKLIVSIAIGVIVSQIVGNLNKTTKYYIFTSRGKTEVPKEMYESSNNFAFPKQGEFNKEHAFTSGVITTSLILMLFFIPSIFKAKQDNNIG